jgi:hypothetical protein
MEEGVSMAAHVTHIGELVGVSFAPAEPEIRLKVGDETLTLAATPEQVEDALSMRNQKIKVLEDSSSADHRAIAVVSAEHVITPRVEKYVFDKWDEALRRLAE